MELVIDHLGFAYGQHDYEMRALEGAEPVGVLSFSEFEGRPHVNWVRVDDRHQHRGIARKLIQNLQGRYPGVPIDFGYTTPEGSRLVEGLRFLEVPNEAYQMAKERWMELKARITEIEASVARLKTAKGSHREAIMASLEDWNAVSDALDIAEGVLLRERPTFRLVETGVTEPECSGSEISP